MKYFRDVIRLVLRSASTCWTVAVHDYGAVISTLLALSTFASLIFLVYILKRTLTSRTPKSGRQQQHIRGSEKHRRKKRKHPIARSGGHKSNGNRSRSSTTLEQPAVVEDIDGPFEIHYDDNHELVRNDDTPQSILPPLAEDEPLDSPPKTVSSLSTSLLSITNCESSHLATPRPRTTSASTMDSVVCSIDDQSSCSGRSTPTAVGANELGHISFVTAIEEPAMRVAEVNGVRSLLDNSVGGTPNRIPTANSRRLQNSRRGGKKNYNSSDSALNNNAGPASAPVPSKRWDALKPTGRSSTSRQQRQPLTNRSRSTHGTQISRFDNTYSTAERGQHVDQNQTTSSPNLNGFAQEPCSTVRRVIAAPLSGLVLDTTNASASNNLSNSKDERDSGSLNQYAPLVKKGSSDDPCSKTPVDLTELGKHSTLNPDSPSWIATRHEGVYSSTGVHHQEQLRPPPGLYSARNDSIYGGYGHVSHNGTEVPVSESPFHYYPSQSAKVPMYQPYLFNAHRSSGNSSEPPKPSPFHAKIEEAGESSPSSDFTFLRNFHDLSLHGVKHGKGLNDSGDEMASLRVSSVDCNTILSSAPSLMSSYLDHHRSPRYVRENPFATSEDDDDQIEAELQELGGQMVGSILDF
jgi:hypothetical protein